MRTICSENILLFGGLNLMNKKELNEIKKNFNDDCGFFTINKVVVYNVPLVKTQMKKIIVTAKTLYSHPKNVSKIYAALHTDLAW